MSRKPAGIDLELEPTRRAVLWNMGIVLAMSPVAGLLGCSSGSDDDASCDDASGDDASCDDDTSSDNDTPDGDDDASPGDVSPTPTVAWATGGTATLADDYPDPFSGAADTPCALYCAMKLGCYAETLERRDISEGYSGLPTRLSLRVVGADGCTPVAGATVDVWHSQKNGLYSGDDADEVCTHGDEDAISHRYFRGFQTTDEEGRVDFDTCFPGWYPTRTVHIHFIIRRGDDEYVTAQLFFDQALIDDILTTQPEYVEYGTPDTTNATDAVFPSEGADAYVMSWKKLDDGVLQLWKTLVIRGSLAEELCTVGSFERAGGSSDL